MEVSGRPATYHSLQSNCNTTMKGLGHNAQSIPKAVYFYSPCLTCSAQHLLRLGSVGVCWDRSKRWTLGRVVGQGWRLLLRLKFIPTASRPRATTRLSCLHEKSALWSKHCTSKMQKSLSNISLSLPQHPRKLQIQNNCVFTKEIPFTTSSAHSFPDLWH